MGRLVLRSPFLRRQSFVKSLLNREQILCLEQAPFQKGDKTVGQFNPRKCIISITSGSCGHYAHQSSIRRALLQPFSIFALRTFNQPSGSEAMSFENVNDDDLNKDRQWTTDYSRSTPGTLQLL